MSKKSYLLKPKHVCPHGHRFSDCADVWCTSRLADVSLQSKYITEPEKPSEAKSVPTPVPEGQSQTAYWQAARAHHMSRGVDKVIAGELAWSDLENVKCQRNPDPAKGMVVMPLVEEQPRSCAACNRSLKNSRATSKYCSRACQQRAYRERQSVTVNPAPVPGYQGANSAQFPPRAGVMAGEAHPVGSRHSGVGVTR